MRTGLSISLGDGVDTGKGNKHCFFIAQVENISSRVVISPFFITFVMSFRIMLLFTCISKGSGNPEMAQILGVHLLPMDLQKLFYQLDAE